MKYSEKVTYYAQKVCTFFIFKKKKLNNTKNKITLFPLRKIVKMFVL